MNIIKQENINIDEIVDALREGKTIVYPTETCYGLGCDATNAEAVNKIFQIKQRQKNKPVLVVASEPSMLMECVKWTPTLERISEKYWPGPLTVVTQTSGCAHLAPGVVADDSSVAFRITNHPLAAELSKKLGKPIVSTSANLAHQESPYDVEVILRMFENNEHQPDIIIDAGPLPHHSVSTVIRLLVDKIEVLRQGEVVVEL